MRESTNGPRFFRGETIRSGDRRVSSRGHRVQHAQREHESPLQLSQQLAMLPVRLIPSEELPSSAVAILEERSLSTGVKSDRRWNKCRTTCTSAAFRKVCPSSGTIGTINFPTFGSRITCVIRLTRPASSIDPCPRWLPWYSPSNARRAGASHGFDSVFASVASRRVPLRRSRRILHLGQRVGGLVERHLAQLLSVTEFKSIAELPQGRDHLNSAISRVPCAGRVRSRTELLQWCVVFFPSPPAAGNAVALHRPYENDCRLALVFRGGLVRGEPLSGFVGRLV